LPSTIIRKLYRLFILTFRYFGTLKFLVFKLSFKPIYRQARRSDMRIVAQKSAALAAQNL
jgi:hypothetical protein